MHKEGWRPEPSRRSRCHPKGAEGPVRDLTMRTQVAGTLAGLESVYNGGVPVCCSGCHQT